MKYRKIGLSCYWFGAILLMFASVGTVVCMAIRVEEDIIVVPLLVAALLSFAPAITLLIVGYRLGCHIDKETAQIFRKYLKYPAKKITDYHAELETVRENFNRDTDPKKNKIAVAIRGYSSIFYDFDVIGNGKICYSYLVEANEALFINHRIGEMTLPAVVIYSLDPYYENNPMALKDLAKSLYANRGNNFLRNESRFFTAQKLTDKEGRAVFVTTIMIYRKHLPLYCITDPLLPLIANPQTSSSVFVVDFKYWTDSLIGNFVHNVSDNPHRVEDVFGIDS